MLTLLELCLHVIKIYIVEPLNEGHVWDLERLERCSDFRGEIEHICMHWDKIQCPNYTECSDFRVSSYRGSTVCVCTVTLNLASYTGNKSA